MGGPYAATADGPGKPDFAIIDKAFDFDYETFDFAAAITKFFDKIAKFIETFGDNIKPDDRLGLAMSATLQGLFKVLSAISTKTARLLPFGDVRLFCDDLVTVILF
jgi:hypothetical protein